MKVKASLSQNATQKASLHIAAAMKTPQAVNKLHIKEMLQNSTFTAQPHTVGLQSKNPYGDFSDYESQLSKMKPLELESNFTAMQQMLQKEIEGKRLHEEQMIG